MVGREGFEPSTNWLKPTALPTELTTRIHEEIAKTDETVITLAKMVGREGFEPSTNWLKANCSTD